MKSYKTILNEGTARDVVKKSKFISYALPVNSVEEAISFIEKIKKMNWNANHNVPVYILGAKFEIQKFSDDGEPSGTAGLPILEMLKKEGITNICIVVTRYFGGIKLGTGGLVRAYGHSAKLVLNESKVIERIEYQKVLINLDYTLHGKIQNFLSLNGNYFVKDTIYTEKVQLIIYVKSDDIEKFQSKIIDLTSDRCDIILGDVEMLSISDGILIK